MASAWVSALRMLAARRLSESQLRKKLASKGFDLDDIDNAVERAKAGRFVDDRLYAELYVETAAKAVGDRRIVGDLVKRGIDRAAAAEAVGAASVDESQRLAAAFDKVMRLRPQTSLASAARALERKGFPAPEIYRHLRKQAEAIFGGGAGQGIDPDESSRL